jgi:hypothetical protein
VPDSNCDAKADCSELGSPPFFGNFWVKRIKIIISKPKLKINDLITMHYTYPSDPGHFDFLPFGEKGPINKIKISLTIRQLERTDTMRKKEFIIILATVSLILTGCMTTNHTIRFPEKIAFQPQPGKQPYTVGIFVAPEDKALAFDQCEKLKGGSMCYHGIAGALLEPSACEAFQQVFEKVILLDGLTDSEVEKADLVVALSFKDVRLDTTLKGFTATRKVTVAIHEQVYTGLKSIASRQWQEATSCVAYKCKVEGKQVGLEGSAVMLKTLFLPGYIAGVSDRYSKIISTAYAASLKTILVTSSQELASKARTIIGR